MGIGNIFRAFQPKDKIFFDLFLRVAENLVEMSKTFHDGLLEFDINDETLLNQMSDYEHKLDDLTHEIFVQLGRTSLHHLTEKISTIWPLDWMILRIIFMLLQNIFIFIKARKIKFTQSSLY